MADSIITALTANTTPAVTDIIPIVDDPGGTPVTQKITLDNLLKVINGLTADASPDTAADYVVTYDTSASSAKKVLLYKMQSVKHIVFTIANSSTAPTTGDGKAHFVVPAGLNGMNITAAIAVVTTVSSSGTPTFALRRERSGSAVDVFSTNVTIDANEKTSATAATAAVINTSNDDLATGDILYADLDTVGTSATGHQLVISVQLP